MYLELKIYGKKRLIKLSFNLFLKMRFKFMNYSDHPEIFIAK